MEERATHITLSDANFRQEVVECEQPVLVLFKSVWSGLSDIMESRLVNLAIRYAGKIKTYKLDLHDDARLADEYLVLTVPTLLVFKHGELVDRLTGLVSETVLATKLDALLG